MQNYPVGKKCMWNYPVGKEFKNDIAQMQPVPDSYELDVYNFFLQNM